MRNWHRTHTFHFEFLHQYLIYRHFWHVQGARQCSCGQMLIVFDDESTVFVFISGTKVLGLPHRGASWTDFQPSFNSLCNFLKLELFRHLFPKVFFSNAIVSSGVFFFFFSRRTRNSLQTCCLIFEFIFFQPKQHLVTRTPILYEHIKTTLCIIHRLFCNKQYRKHSSFSEYRRCICIICLCSPTSI